MHKKARKMKVSNPPTAISTDDGDDTDQINMNAYLFDY